jgi:hypothetical protein
MRESVLGPEGAGLESDSEPNNLKNSGQDWAELFEHWQGWWPRAACLIGRGIIRVNGNRSPAVGLGGAAGRNGAEKCRGHRGVVGHETLATTARGDRGDRGDGRLRLVSRRIAPLTAPTPSAGPWCLSPALQPARSSPGPGRSYRSAAHRPLTVAVVIAARSKILEQSVTRNHTGSST